MIIPFVRERLPFLLLCFLIGLSLNGTGCSESPPTASIREFSGLVRVRPGKNTEFHELKEPESLREGAEIRTGADSTAKVVFADQSEISLRPQSYFLVGNSRNLGTQTGGTINYQIKKNPKGVTVKTPMGVTAVLGTGFDMEVLATATILFLEEGSIEFTSPTAKQELKPGETMTVSESGEMSPPRKLSNDEESRFSRLRKSKLKQLLDRETKEGK